MRIDIFLQRILWQAHNLYERGIDKSGSIIQLGPEALSFGSYCQASELYDFLIKTGHTIDYENNIKKEMYRMSILIFNREHKRMVADDKTSDERKKSEVVKYYKSLLVRKYLLDRFAETGEKVIFQDENGSVFNRIDLVPRPEGGNKYIEL